MLFGTLGVLAPLRLAQLGVGAIGIGALWLFTGAFEAVNNIFIGRATDRHAPLAPIGVALVGTIVVAALLPWPNDKYALAVLIVCAGLSFGAFYTPGMTMLTQAAESRGLAYGYAFALMNLAWAPGQSAGAALGGAVAQETSNAVPYLTLSGVALLTLLLLWRSRSFS
jgi:predicted MFS family arabinose efflux permease